MTYEEAENKICPHRGEMVWCNPHLCMAWIDVEVMECPCGGTSLPQWQNECTCGAAKDERVLKQDGFCKLC